MAADGLVRWFDVVPEDAGKIVEARLRDGGMLRVLDGVTSLEEILRVVV